MNNEEKQSLENNRKQVKVLFVCMGNICRSPTAEGVFRKMVSEAGLDNRIEIDSAGTHAYHVGESPDRRAQAAATNRGVDLSGLRGRKFEETDFDTFDYILAMDRDNYKNMIYLQPEQPRGQLSLFLDFAANYSETEVPDPYYGGARGFEFVLDLVEDASRGLLQDIRARHGL